MAASSPLSSSSALVSSLPSIFPHPLYPPPPTILHSVSPSSTRVANIRFHASSRPSTSLTDTISGFLGIEGVTSITVSISTELNPTSVGKPGPSSLSSSSFPYPPISPSLSSSSYADSIKPHSSTKSPDLNPLTPSPNTSNRGHGPSKPEQFGNSSYSASGGFGSLTASEPTHTSHLGNPLNTGNPAGISSTPTKIAGPAGNPDSESPIKPPPHDPGTASSEEDGPDPTAAPTSEQTPTNTETSVTGTVTIAPTDFSIAPVTRAQSENGWITSTIDGHPTLLPVVGGFVLFNSPTLPRVQFSFPGFPELPSFNFPCIKVLGFTVAGCNSPPVGGEDDGGSDDDDGENQTTTAETTTAETSTTPTTTTTEQYSCTESSTVSSCSSVCSTTGTSLSCFSRTCSTTIGCSVTQTDVTSTVSACSVQPLNYYSETITAASTSTSSSACSIQPLTHYTEAPTASPTSPRACSVQPLMYYVEEPDDPTESDPATGIGDPVLTSKIYQTKSITTDSPSATITNPSKTTGYDPRATRIACGERFVEETDMIPIPEAIPRRFTNDILRRIRDFCLIDTWEEIGDAINATIYKQRINRVFPMYGDVELTLRFDFDKRPECEDYDFREDTNDSCGEFLSQVTNACEGAEGMDRRGGVFYHNCKSWGWEADTFEKPENVMIG